MLISRFIHAINRPRARQRNRNNALVSSKVYVTDKGKSRLYRILFVVTAELGNVKLKAIA